MRRLYYIFLCICCAPLALFAQESEADTVKVVDKPQRPAFESAFLIDNPTDKLYIPNTLEVVMQHRFGTIGGQENDLLGIWGAANIRIGLNYTIHERLQLGFGTTKNNRVQDFNWKVGILRQTRSDKIPVNVSYYGNWAINATKWETLQRQYPYFQDQHRYSYLHQLIISRRFNQNLSLQVVPSLSHFNLVEEKMRNSLFTLSVGGRYKVSPQTAITIEHSHPFGHHLDRADLPMDPEPGFRVRAEFVTSSHAFQVYLSSSQGIVPQYNFFQYQNQFFKGWDGILLGFTITRLYNF